MQREIKFRAWDNQAKEMVTALWRMKIDLNGHIYWTIDHLDGNLRFVESEETDGDNRFILMQYTGLKDKNGKEIYEGDVLGGSCELVTMQGKPTGKFNESRHVVTWRQQDSGFATRQIYDSRDPEFYANREVFGILSIAVKYYPIIGNIHDNPELLK